jgi:predicted DsbA family dithiol-disulfide isomerase
MHGRMQGLMDAEGLPYGRRTHTYNSRLAQELAKWADARREGDRLHHLIYRAYFVDGRNIGDPSVLADLASAAGLPLDEVREVLERRTWRDAVDADWTMASRSAITGVPTFVAGGQQAVGAQPEPVLRGLLDTAGAQPRITVTGD